MLSFLCREYHWTPEYILKKLTWSQVFMFYEHGLAHLQGKEVEYEIEPPPLENAIVNKNGERVYNR